MKYSVNYAAKVEGNMSYCLGYDVNARTPGAALDKALDKGRKEYGVKFISLEKIRILMD